MRKLFCLSMLSLLLVVRIVWAQAPITVQGVATDSQGLPLLDGAKNITFSIYEFQESKTPLWSEQQIVAIKEGLFTTTLGSVNPLNLTADKPYWLGMKIGDDEEMSPRLKLITTGNNSISSVNGKTTLGGTAVTLAANTLDEAYDGGGSGAGRTITADAGAVNIEGAGGLTVEGSIGVGTTTPAAGVAIHLKDGRMRISHGSNAPGFTLFDDADGDFFRLQHQRSGDQFEIRNSFDAVVFMVEKTGEVGIGTTAPSAVLDVVGNTELNGDVDINSDLDVDDGTLFVDGTNDRVGIGTTTPNEQLEITKNFRLPTTTPTSGIIFKGEDLFIHNFGDNSNLFVGVNAGNLTMTGDAENTGIGQDALSNTTSGNSNTAIGPFSLAKNTEGGGNTATGAGALFRNIEGDRNTAFGVSTLVFNTTGNLNTAIGNATMITNATGSSNTALGQFADVSVNNLTHATAIGANAIVGSSNSVVLGRTSDNVGIGTTTSSSRLDVVGNTELNGDVDINSDLDVDDGTLHVDETNDNVGIGTVDPKDKLDVRGTVLGHGNGANIGSMSPNNIAGIIGVSAAGVGGISGMGAVSGFIVSNDAATAALYGKVFTGNGALGLLITTEGTGDVAKFKENNNIALIIKDGGNVGIGTENPTAQLHTTGTVRFATFGAGDLQTDADGNLFVASDERLKNIKSNFERGLSVILKIDPINYTWKQESGLDTKNTYTGFSAQNIQDVIPEAVNKDKNGYLTLSDRPIIATLVNAVKAINNKNEVTKAENTKLKIDLENLNSKVAQLESVLQKIIAAKPSGPEVEKAGSE